MSFGYRDIATAQKRFPRRAKFAWYSMSLHARQILGCHIMYAWSKLKSQDIGQATRVIWLLFTIATHYEHSFTLCKDIEYVITRCDCSIEMSCKDRWINQACVMYCSLTNEKEIYCHGSHQQ